MGSQFKKPKIQLSFPNTVTHQEVSMEILWGDLRSGEKSALEAIYKLYIKDLYNFGMSLYPDESLVKDAIQDVFIDLWNYKENLGVEVEVKHYLFKSVSNRIQKELGKNVKRTKIHKYTDQELLVDSCEDEMVRTQSESEITGKMYRALANLPIRQKEVLQYLFFEKHSYEETAKLLEINIRSTYTLAWKAINALKKAISMITIVYFFFHI